MSNEEQNKKVLSDEDSSDDEKNTAKTKLTERTEKKSETENEDMQTHEERRDTGGKGVRAYQRPREDAEDEDDDDDDDEVEEEEEEAEKEKKNKPQSMTGKNRPKNLVNIISRTDLYFTTKLNAPIVVSAIFDNETLGIALKYKDESSKSAAIKFLEPKHFKNYKLDSDFFKKLIKLVTKSPLKIPNRAPTWYNESKCVDAIAKELKKFVDPDKYTESYGIHEKILKREDKSITKIDVSVKGDSNKKETSEVKETSSKSEKKAPKRKAEEPAEHLEPKKSKPTPSNSYDEQYKQELVKMRKYREINIQIEKFKGKVWEKYDDFDEDEMLSRIKKAIKLL